MAEAVVDEAKGPARARKVPAAEKLAEMVIAQLEAGTAPWMRPVAPGVVGEPCRNAKTDHEYRGANQVILSMLQPGGDPRWCTIHQANELGAKVRKGERGVPISAHVGWQTEDGRRVERDEDAPAGARPLFRVYHVFHASQLDGLEEYAAAPSKDLDWEPDQRTENLIGMSGANIVHDQSTRCFYRPRTDTIHLPPKENFRGSEAYHATALHELGHWTGHESRLGRDLSGKFGSESYAREELRAELGSYMLALELGIGHDPSNHAAYVKSWVKVLREDPAEIYRASDDASKIVDFVMGRERQRAVERGDEPREAAAEELAAPAAAWANAAALGVPEDRGGPIELPAGGVYGLRFTRYPERGTDVHVRLGDRPMGLIEARADGSWEFTAARAGRDFGLPVRLEGGAHEEVALGLQNRFYEGTLQRRRVVLDVPAGARESVEAMGATWDESRKALTAAVTPLNLGKFGTWLTGPTQLLSAEGREVNEERAAGAQREAERGGGEKPERAASVEEETPAGRAMPGKAARVDLAVPYSERTEAKALGAKWDRQGKTWYVMLGEGEDLGGLARWKDDGREARRGAPAPEEEFAAVCRAAGLVLEGAPIMDGKLHRVPVEGGRPGARDGAYVAHLDDHPAGFAHNWKSDDTQRWKYTGEGHAIARHAESVREVDERAADRRREREAEQAARAEEIRADLETMGPASPQHPYLVSHGVSGRVAESETGAGAFGARQDEDGNLVVPLRDMHGAVSSVQRISANGFKRFEKGGAISGRFHVVGDSRQLHKGPLLLTTGFATAAAIHAATGRPVVAAMSDTNLAKVAEGFRDRVRHAVVILADDDRHKEVNAGQRAAEKALDVVRVGRVAYPQWTAAEREDKGMSDFADVAVARGLGAVKRQVDCEIAKAVELAKEHEAELTVNRQAAKMPQARTQGRER